MTDKTYQYNGRVTNELHAAIRTLTGFVRDESDGSRFFIICSFTTQQEQDDFENFFKEKSYIILNDVIEPPIVPPTDISVYVTEKTVTKSNLGNTYVNLAPDFSGRPFLVDTSGFTRAAFDIIWNKNSGTGNHSMQVVDHADTSKILYETVLTQGINIDTNAVLPKYFRNFKGRLRIQVKSDNGGLDSPTFERFCFYLRR